MPLKRVVAQLFVAFSVAASLMPAKACGRRATNAAMRSGFGVPPGRAARCASTIARKSSGMRGGNALRLSAVQVLAPPDGSSKRTPMPSGLPVLAFWRSAR